MNKISIFVVEDHQLFRKGLINALKEFSDMNVIGEAATFREAMEQLKKLQPKIVIMDVFLPDGDGIEVASEIRCRFSGVEVVILTISDDMEILNRAIRAGVKGYLVKGNGLREIVETIRLVARGNLAISPLFDGRLYPESKKDEENQSN